MCPREVGSSTSLEGAVEIFKSTVVCIFVVPQWNFNLILNIQRAEICILAILGAGVQMTVLG